MVREILENEIKNFIAFGDNLYKGDKNYVPYVNGDLYKTLKKLVFVKKTYYALCHFDVKGKIDGRILLTVNKNKQLSCDNCGYFSHFEVVNDYEVFKELIDYSVSFLKEKGAKYFVGSFFNFDPDNRRGILIDNFTLFPMIFTSYNKPYYKDFFEKANFAKLVDALEYEYVEDEEKTNKIKTIAQKSVIENDIHIDKLNYKQIDKDIEDVHTVMEIASTKINFENVLSKEKIKKIFNSWKVFIDPNFAFIARKNSDNSPVGFTLAIKNYNEVIKKMKGKTNIFAIITFLLNRKRIKGLRAVLQYVIPDYQHKGISKALYLETKKAVDKYGIKRIGLGTIMENNASSNGSIISLGGVLSKTYRVYYLDCN